MLLTVQSLVICVLERDTTRQFHLSVYACITCAIILAGLIGGNTAIRDYEYADAPVVVLMAIETVSSALGILTFGLIDRRPQVFRDGRRVDAEFTVSIWSKLSFTWAAPVLAFARRNKKLDLKDLPMLPKYVRTETLSLNFGHARKFDRLWKTLIWAFRWVFFLQIGLSTTAAVLQFVPQLCMYMILKLLEQRSSGSYPAGIAWAWVFGLGLAMLAISFVESWMYFMIFGELGIPIRNTLSTLVFEKSLRRKDVKSAGKTASTMIIHAAPMSSTATNEATTPHEQNNTTSIAENNKEVEDVETEEKTRQGVVNMIGVDAKRVADWLTFSYFFWTAPIKLLISLSFLYTMIGGWPLLAGLAAFSLTIPVNIWLSKIYTTLQGDLMSFRDEKLRIVTECLQGIRQIKL